MEIFDAITRGSINDIRSILKKNPESANSVCGDKNAACFGFTPIIYAADLGSLEIMKYLKSHGSDVNLSEESPQKRKIIHVVCSKNQYEVLKYLIKSGISPNEPSSNGNLPIHFAALSNGVECLSLLLREGVNVNEVNGDKKTPLHFAAQSNNGEVVKYLIKKGADKTLCDKDGRYPMDCTESESVKSLLKGGGTSGATVVKNEPNDFETAVALIEKGDMNNFKKICESKPGILEERDANGFMLFHLAVLNQRFRHTEYLIGKIDNYDVPVGVDGRTAIHIAIENQNMDIIDIIEEVANMDAPDNSGETPAMLKARLANPKLARFNEALKLLKNRQHVEMSKFIIGTNTMKEARDDGITLIHWAALSNQPIAISILMEQESDVNAQNRDGNTPLHFAAKYNYPKCIKALLDFGADQTIENLENKVSLMLAEANNAEEAVSVLKTYVPRINTNNFPLSADAMRRQNSPKQNNSIKEKKTHLPTPPSEVRSRISSASNRSKSSRKKKNASKANEIENQADAEPKRRSKHHTRNPDGNPLDSPTHHVHRRSHKHDAAQTFEVSKEQKPVVTKLSSGSEEIAQTTIEHLKAKEVKNEPIDIFSQEIKSFTEDQIITPSMQKIIDGVNEAITNNKLGKFSLFPAIINGSLITVEKLISRKADVNEKTIFGNPLIAAIVFDRVEIMQKLLESDAYANGADLKGILPFITCIREGNGPTLRLLAENGCNINIDVDGLSPFFTIIKRNIPEMGEVLIEYGANTLVKNKEGRTPLAQALFEKLTDMARALSKGITDVSWCLDGEPILHVATHLGNGDLVSNLLSQGADPKIPDQNGKLPLQVAIDEGKGDVVSAFLANEASLEEIDEEGRTILYRSALAENYENVRLLCQKGANMSVVAFDGVPLLMAVINQKKIKIALTLIENGAPLDQCDLDGNHPLHRAARIGSKQLIQVILARNISINIQNRMKETPLLVAIRSKQFETATYLISNGANMSLPDKNSVTPIHAAVNVKSEEMLDLLLMKGALFDTPDANGNTPLLIALKNDAHNILMTLFNKGCEVVRTKDSDGVTPLHLAAASGMSAFVSMLIGKGVSIDPVSKTMATPLFMSIKNNHMSIAFQLLDLTSNIKITDKDGQTLMHINGEKGNLQFAEKVIEKGGPFDNPDKNGVTPIMVALKFKNISLAQFLLSKGAKTNVTDNNGDSVVHYAAAAAKLEFFQIIAESRVDIHALNKFGQSPLFKAAEAANIPVVQYLIKREANTAIKDKDNHSLLWVAAKSRSMRVLDIILASGCNPNTFGDGSPSTPLIDVIAGGTVTAAEVLLNHGSDPNGKGSNGSTPLHWCAANKDKVSTAGLLVQRGADIGAKDNLGNTPLHTACDNNVVDMIEFLLEKGADINDTNQNGETPFTYALDRENPDVIKLLLLKGANITPENFVWCCASGLFEIVDMLIQKGIDTNSRDDDGNVGLSFAIDSNNLPLVQLLLKNGANINISSSTGHTSLFYIEKRTNTKIIGTIIKSAMEQKKISKYNQRELYRISKFVSKKKRERILSIPNLLPEDQLCAFNVLPPSLTNKLKNAADDFLGDILGTPQITLEDDINVKNPILDDIPIEVPDWQNVDQEDLIKEAPEDWRNTANGEQLNGTENDEDNIFQGTTTNTWQEDAGNLFMNDETPAWQNDAQSIKQDEQTELLIEPPGGVLNEELMELPNIVQDNTPQATNQDKEEGVSNLQNDKGEDPENKEAQPENKEEPPDNKEEQPANNSPPFDNEEVIPGFSFSPIQF